MKLKSKLFLWLLEITALNYQPLNPLDRFTPCYLLMGRHAECILYGDFDKLYLTLI